MDGMNPGAPALRLPVVALLAVAACIGAPTAAMAQSAERAVTIYRCTDTQGRLSLRDTPCGQDERQQATSMRRPLDPPTRPAEALPEPFATSTGTAASAPEPRVRVYLPAPPVYRCTTPDGDRYTSDSPEGNPRWVPLWTLGYPVIVGPGHGHHPGDYQPVRPARHAAPTQRPLPSTVDNRPGFVFDSVGRPPPTPSHTGPGIPDRLPVGGIIQAPGIWVRDACMPIPQAEVCAELRARRIALVRRYNSALQSERRDIDQEKRDIDERLASGCSE